MDATRRNQLVLVLIASAVVVWGYWTTLYETAERWSTDPQYSHGFLVPIFSLVLLWLRRDKIPAAGFTPRWWGLGLLALALVIRFAGVAMFQPWLEAMSLLVALAGLAACIGGRTCLIWAAPAIAFLAFMVPLPYRFQTMLGGKLQSLATTASTYVLQTIGIPAISEGNVILLSESRIGVVEACSGLSMLVTFFAIAAGYAFLVKKPLWMKLILVLSAIPIAVIANVIRISVTGMLYEANQSEWAKTVFHDVAGWLMMPLALVMLAIETSILGRLIVPIPERTYRSLVRPKVAATRA